MITTLTIETLQRSGVKKDKDTGAETPYINKLGKRFEVVKIKTQYDGQTVFMSTLDYDGWTKELREGMTAEFVVTQDEWPDTKTPRYSFQKVRKLDQMEIKIGQIDKRVSVLEGKDKKVEFLPAPPPTVEDINLDSLPF